MAERYAYAFADGTFFTQLLTYCLKYTMRTMQSCLIEIYQDGEHSENSNSKNTSEKAIRMSASSETWQLGSQTVQVSHLEKRYWPQTGFTKGDIRSRTQRSPISKTVQ